MVTTRLKQSEIGLVPVDWPIIKLGEVANFTTGPFGSALHKSDYVNDGVPVVNPMHIVDGDIKISGSMTVSDDKAKQLAKYRLLANDIIIGRRGEMGRCAVVEPHQQNYLCGTGSLIIRCNNRVSPHFLRRIISSPPTISAIEESSVGTTMVNLNQDVLSNLFVPNPALVEQIRIAAALSDVDALIASLDKLIAKKRDIKTAVMQQLLTGKKRLPGFSGTWNSVRLGEVGEFAKGKGLAKIDIMESGKLPAIPYTAIYTDFDEVIDVNLITNFTSSSGLVTINSPHLLIAGSSNMLENIGKATAFDSRQEVAIGGDIILFNTFADVCFLSYLLNTKRHRAAIVSLSQGSTIRHVYASTFANYQIVLPGFEEQLAISSLLLKIDKEIVVLEKRREKTRMVKQGMMQELLTGRTRLV